MVPSNQVPSELLQVINQIRSNITDSNASNTAAHDMPIIYLAGSDLAATSPFNCTNYLFVKTAHGWLQLTSKNDVELQCSDLSKYQVPRSLLELGQFTMNCKNENNISLDIAVD